MITIIKEGFNNALENFDLKSKKECIDYHDGCCHPFGCSTD